MRVTRFFLRYSRQARATGLAMFAGALAFAGATSILAQDRYDPGRTDFPTSPIRADDDVVYGAELPVYVSVVDGYAELDRAGQSSRDIENVPLEEGDRIRTTRGRAELLFDDGSSIALDDHTTVVFASASTIDLLSGRVRLQWRDRDRRGGLTIATAAGQVLVRTAGDYRVSLGTSRRGETEIELAVSAGSAELANAAGRTIVRERTRALTVAGMAPSLPYQFIAPRDEFERWTDDVEHDRYGVESSRYLPDELRSYGGVFDRHGYWHRHASYGWVWYPRVSVGWRPYYGGRWSFVVGFGYSWVGGSRWAWPTHHYGRWDCVGTTWFWIPVRPDHRRAVGYAVPRSSYTDRVTYYQRGASYQRGSSQWGNRNVAPGPGRDVSRTVAPRNNDWRPADRPTTDRPSDQPSSGGQRTFSRPAPSRPADDRPGAVRRPENRPAGDDRPASRPAPRTSERDDSPRPQRAAPSTRSAPPQRSEPSATSGPPSGSRSPSRASGGNNSGGTARRRGGGS